MRFRDGETRDARKNRDSLCLSRTMDQVPLAPANASSMCVRRGGNVSVTPDTSAARDARGGNVSVTADTVVLRTPMDSGKSNGGDAHASD